MIDRAVVEAEPVTSTPIIRPPIYDPKKHVQGDLVRKWVNGAWQELIVPELDGDNNEVPEI